MIQGMNQSRSAYTDPQPAMPSEVSLQLDNLRSSVAHLSSLCLGMEERLAPVLSGAGNGVDPTAPVPVMNSPIGGEIQAVQQHIEACALRLSTLTQRLCI